MLRQFLKDSALYGLTGIISKGISFFLVPLYTRVFVPADYGVIDYLAVVAALINMTVALEVSQAVARFHPEVDEQGKRRLVSTALWWTMGAYGVWVSVCFGFAPQISRMLFDSAAYADIFRLAMLGTLGYGVFNLMQGQLRYDMRPKAFATANVANAVSTIGVTVVLVLVLHFGVIGTFYGQLTGFGVGIVISYFFARNRYAFEFDRAMWREMLSFSAPLVLSGLGVFVSMYVDRLSIKELMTLSDVGLYGVGARFASLVGVALAGTRIATTPLIYKRYREEDTPRQLARVFRYFSGAMMIIVLGMALFSREVVVLMTAPAYYSSHSVIPLLGAATVLANLYIFAPGLALAKQTRLVAIINIAAAVLNLGLNVVLIPILGIVGAALATMTASAVAFAAYMVTSQRHYPVPHRWRGIVIATVSTAVLATTGALPWSVSSAGLIARICGFVVGTALVVAFIDDRHLVRRYVARFVPSITA